MFIRMSWNSRKPIKILVNLVFETLDVHVKKQMFNVKKSAAKLCDKKDTFPLFLLISISCPLWIALPNLKYFMTQSVLKFHLLSGPQDTRLLW